MTAYRDIFAAGKLISVELDSFPGYRVTVDGRVQTDLVCGSKNHRRTGVWRDLSLRTKSIPGHRYQDVTLYGKKIRVHRLVLESFVGPCPPGMECLHEDGDPFNNKLSNLKWGTRVENQADRVRHKMVPRGLRHWNARLTEDDVAAIRTLLKRGHTTSFIAPLFGISRITVSKIGRGVIRRVS